MRKFLFILFAFVAFAVINESKAQVVDFGSADTLTNTDTSRTYSKSVKVGLNAHVSIQPVVNRLSGTLAGTIVIFGSLNDTTYVPLDTITITNAATFSTIVDYPYGPYRFYRVIFYSSGTVSCRVRALLYARKFD